MHLLNEKFTWIVCNTSLQWLVSSEISGNLWLLLVWQTLGLGLPRNCQNMGITCLLFWNLCTRAHSNFATPLFVRRMLWWLILQLRWVKRKSRICCNILMLKSDILYIKLCVRVTLFTAKDCAFSPHVVLQTHIQNNSHNTYQTKSWVRTMLTQLMQTQQHINWTGSSVVHPFST